MSYYAEPELKEIKFIDAVEGTILKKISFIPHPGFTPNFFDKKIEEIKHELSKKISPQRIKIVRE